MSEEVKLLQVLDRHAVCTGLLVFSSSTRSCALSNSLLSVLIQSLHMPHCMQEAMLREKGDEQQQNQNYHISCFPDPWGTSRGVMLLTLFNNPVARLLGSQSQAVHNNGTRTSEGICTMEHAMSLFSSGADEIKKKVLMPSQISVVVSPPVDLPPPAAAVASSSLFDASSIIKEHRTFLSCALGVLPSSLLLLQSKKKRETSSSSAPSTSTDEWLAAFTGAARGSQVDVAHLLAQFLSSLLLLCGCRASGEKQSPSEFSPLLAEPHSRWHPMRLSAVWCPQLLELFCEHPRLLGDCEFGNESLELHLLPTSSPSYSLSTTPGAAASSATAFEPLCHTLLRSSASQPSSAVAHALRALARAHSTTLTTRETFELLGKQSCVANEVSTKDYLKILLDAVIVSASDLASLKTTFVKPLLQTFKAQGKPVCIIGLLEWWFDAKRTMIVNDCDNDEENNNPFTCREATTTASKSSEGGVTIATRLAYTEAQHHQDRTATGVIGRHLHEALRQAVSEERVASSEWLLQSGAPVVLNGPATSTPSVAHGRSDFCSNGPSYGQSPDRQGHTLLMLAAERCNMELLELLVHHFKKQQQQEQQQQEEQQERRHVTTGEFSEWINRRSHKGSTALLLAMQNGANFPLLSYLAQLEGPQGGKTDPNRSDSVAGRSPSSLLEEWMMMMNQNDGGTETKISRGCNSIPCSLSHAELIQLEQIFNAV